MNARLRSRLLAVVCAGLVADLLVQPIRALRDLQDTDFVNFMAASRILREGGCLYCAGAQRAATNVVLGGVPTGHVVAFVGPPMVAAAFSPLSVMDPHVALGLFLVVSLLGIGVAAWLIASRLLPGLSTPRRLALLAATAASAPAAWGLALGQSDPLLFCAVVGGIILCRRWPIVGGLLISVLLVKPQLILLIVVALIFGRNWRVLGGIALGAVGVAVSTVALMGWSRVLDWPRFVASQYDLIASHSISVPLFFGTLVGSTTVTLAVSLLLYAIGVALLWRRRALLSDPATALALGLILTMTASPHVLAYDALFLTIPLAWLARSEWGPALTLALLMSAAYVVDSVAVPVTAWAEPLVLAGIATAVVAHGGRIDRAPALRPGMAT